jgi:hypothetical protein
MTDEFGIDEATVARLLAAQGYAAPESDLPEIAHRVREAHRFARGWDAYALQAHEPWWPQEIDDA